MNREVNHHHHHHAPPDYNRAFAVGVALNVVFVIVEAVYGVLSDSLALLTDAGHNLSDVLGLLLAWGAALLARKRRSASTSALGTARGTQKARGSGSVARYSQHSARSGSDSVLGGATRPSARRTYGFSRATIIASLFSGLLLVGAVGAIGWEAVNRLVEPVQPAGKTIMVVAAIGVVINTVTALFFLSGKDRDLNIRGAFLHMSADAAVSLGVVASGALIFFYGLSWIAAVIMLSTWGLLRDSLNLAVDAVPRSVDPSAVREYLAGLPGVRAIHDLHIWAMSTTDTALTAHLVMDALPDSDQYLIDVSRVLRDRFSIDHPTIQLERYDSDTVCHQSLHCAD